MSLPHIGEIRMAGFNFAPNGWAHCDGQLLSISEYGALFSLIGKTYGGDGLETFGLPDLRDRVPLHAAPGTALGLSAGAFTHMLSKDEMPGHTHTMQASSAVSHFTTPTNKVLGNVEAGALNIYGPSDGTTKLAASSLSSTGGGQAHQNTQPTAVINFIICLEGIFPSQT